MFDSSLIECELTAEAISAEAISAKPSSQPSSKRFRQPDTRDLRSPTNSRRAKKHDGRNKYSRQDNSRQDHSLPKEYLFLTNEFRKRDFLTKKPSLLFFQILEEIVDLHRNPTLTLGKWHTVLM